MLTSRWCSCAYYMVSSTSTILSMLLDMGNPPSDQNETRASFSLRWPGRETGATIFWPSSTFLRNSTSSHNCLNVLYSSSPSSNHGWTHLIPLYARVGRILVVPSPITWKTRMWKIPRDSKCTSSAQYLPWVLIMAKVIRQKIRKKSKKKKVDSNGKNEAVNLFPTVTES